VHPKSISATAAVIGEPKPLSFELILKNTVLFDEIVDDRLLVAIKPACQGNYEEMERLYDVCHCTNRISVIFSDNNIIRLVRIFAPYARYPFHCTVTPGKSIAAVFSNSRSPLKLEFATNRVGKLAGRLLHGQLVAGPAGRISTTADQTSDTT